MKKSVQVVVNTIDKVKSFVNCNSKFDGDVDVISGRYVIDGKSIMGMFSLDLARELSVIIESESDKAVEALVSDYKNNNLM